MDYESMSMPELRELAKNRKVEKISMLRKQQLIEAIKNTESSSAPEPPKAEAPVMKAANNEESEPKNVRTGFSGAKTSAVIRKRPQQGRDERTRQFAVPGQSYSYRQQAQSVRHDTQHKDDTRTVQEQKHSSETENGAYSISSQLLKFLGGDPEVIAKDAVDVNGRVGMTAQRLIELASMENADGILEVMPEGYGFIRSDNFLPGEKDIYVGTPLIRRLGLKTGDHISGGVRQNVTNDDKVNKYSALLFVRTVNGESLESTKNRPEFEKLTPIYPNERIHLAHEKSPLSMRITDLLSPIGKGQRGMIVAPPKAGKTTLLKQIAKSVRISNPEMMLIVLLIDERPEEVTDIKEAIEYPGVNAQVIYSTFDELPEHHRRVAEMVLGRAKRLVEHGKDVMILLDSITRLARAYNQTVTPSGRTLSGGLDPAALYAPKRFFGAARNMRQGGSLTILATALVDTGSRMDDVVFEEFKGTGNMELVLNRKLSEKRVFPAIDIAKSGTRNENLLLTPEEQEAIDYIRKSVSGMKGEEAAENVVSLFAHTKNNADFLNQIRKTRLI